MSKKTIDFDLKHLLQSHFDDVKKIKSDNLKKDQEFQSYAKKLHKQIHSNDDQFNDI